MRSKTRVRIAAAIVCAAVFAGAAAARTSSVAREYRHFGLFGTWAPNCGQGASPDNPRVTVGLEAGAVLEKDEFGDGYERNHYLIVAARHIDARRLAIEALFAQGDAEPQRQLIVMRVENRTRRTLFTGAANEPPLVKDGIAIALGKPTPTLTKCD